MVTRLLAVPNVSEGRDASFIAKLVDALSDAGTRVLDVHSDRWHNRSVFTVAGDGQRLAAAGAALALACRSIDLTTHRGVHPRLGGLDVYPVVPHLGTMSEAVEAAQWAAEAIAQGADLPVYLYGAAARRPEARELPDLRRGGLEALMKRAAEGFVPDLGPPVIDPARGVVCVGARSTLIAFNVWLRCDGVTAAEIARAIREDGKTLPGVRALGLEISREMSQVSMNLTDPDATGIDAAFQAVADAAAARGIAVERSEIVGLVPARYLPEPDARAARLLSEPGRSLESALAG